MAHCQAHVGKAANTKRKVWNILTPDTSHTDVALSLVGQKNSLGVRNNLTTKIFEFGFGFTELNLKIMKPINQVMSLSKNRKQIRNIKPGGLLIACC